MTKTTATKIAQGVFLLVLGTSWQSTAFAGGNEDSDAARGMGQPGHVKDVSRTIKITAQDMKFIPAILDVQASETVRFVVTNTGPSKHEFVIGADAGDHAKDGASEDHETAGEANEVELAPGETKELIWTFGSAQEIEFACHQPGHYESGMSGRIVVKP